MKIVLKYRIDGHVVESSETENDIYEIFTFNNGARESAVIKTKRPVLLLDAYIVQRYEYTKNDYIFVNGYQSWTDTKEYRAGKNLRSLNHLPSAVRNTFHFAEYGDSYFLKYRPGRVHGFTYSYVKKKDGNVRFWGSLNENNAYLIICHEAARGRVVLHSDVRGRTVDGEFTLFDFVTYDAPVKQAQDMYFASYGTCTAQPLRGYTSWYNDYQNINEKKMLKALDGLDSSEYDLFQIDDGYETFVGDWLDIDKNKFPNGLKGIVDLAHGKGLKAGIWLAPFVAEKDSALFKEHPDWILRRNGEPVFAGCNWSGQAALDIRKEPVMDHIKKCLEFYKDMGFDFFKLDFLYAAALAGGDGRYTRAEIMRKAMETLREILKDRLILGCGVPLSSAFNLADYCRIGPDITLTLDDKFYMKFMHRERTSTKVTLLNTIYRYPMDGKVFRCDPDVYLLRDDNIKLTKDQKTAVTIINHLFGSLYLTSDNVADYDDEKLAVLHTARELSCAQVTDIRCRGSLVFIKYEKGGQSGKLVYNSAKGVLYNG